MANLTAAVNVTLRPSARGSVATGARRCCRTASRGFRGEEQLFRSQPGRRGWAQRLFPRRAAAEPTAGAYGEASSQPEPVQDFQVFPRLKERDPYRKLGVSRDASFEEIQAARNFLVEQYRWHEASRESIEMSFEKILSEKIHVRNKYGFRPPSTGRKTDVEGDPEPTNLVDAIKGAVEPDLPVTTIVNEGVIYVALAVWAGIQSVAADPILPMGLGFGYSAYKIFDKRQKRNPDGPYFGNSPIWGSILMALLGMMLGLLVGFLAVRFLPFPSFIQPQSFAVGMIPAMCGVMAICFK